jgi:LmbE family N-acetylglucosaminyl deacetylase
VPARNPSTAIVAAHPDDEALWLSSALASADRTVLCFGAIFERPRDSHARQQAVAELPITGLIHLDIPESGAGFRLEPPVPELTSAGIRIEKPDARARYESNYERLVEALRTTLVGTRDICTHNPWGEYGHPEHIQVYRAVAALQGELGYTIWFSNYMGPASWLFATHMASRVHCAERRLVAPDRLTARKLMQIYRRHGAWTWNRAHCWPVEETFFSQPPADDPAPRRTLCGEWLLDATRLRWTSMPWRPLGRRLPALGQLLGREGDVHTPPLAG